MLGDLLELKKTATRLDPDTYYALPKLDSENNTVKAKDILKLGRNFANDTKVIAERGDLIIGTLHTNNGNGLFAISNGKYACTSQLVARIKTNLIPTQYLIQALRREFPRQLIPTDLVGRETFTSKQILDVLIPKPTPECMKKLRNLDSEISLRQDEVDEKKEQMVQLLNEFTGVQN